MLAAAEPTIWTPCCETDTGEHYCLCGLAGASFFWGEGGREGVGACRSGLLSGAVGWVGDS
jgi:hypothetical protein